MKKKPKIVIIDDCISKAYQDSVESILDNPDFPWYFNSQISLPGTSDTNTGFSHAAFRKDGNDIHQSKYFEILLPVLFEAVDKFKKGHIVQDIYRIRCAMFVKNQNDDNHMPHIDQHYKHHVMLYYVDDSDGPTLFYDGDKVIKQIHPKKGRCVIFPGETYHASSCPRENTKRHVINYNFLL
tara:strand:+ start:151 stop:696 length:546 start_codon:yes stop_codon:yes gene_type:complete